MAKPREDHIPVLNPITWGKYLQLSCCIIGLGIFWKGSRKTTPCSKRASSRGSKAAQCGDPVLTPKQTELLPRPLFSGGIPTGICLLEGHVKIIMESRKHFNLFMGTNDLSKSKELYLKYTLDEPNGGVYNEVLMSPVSLSCRHI